MRILLIIIFLFYLFHSLDTHIATFKEKPAVIDEITALIPGIQSIVKNHRQPILYISNNKEPALLSQTQFVMTPNILINDRRKCIDCSLVLFVKDKRMEQQDINLDSLLQHYRVLRSDTNHSFEFTLYRKL